MTVYAKLETRQSSDPLQMKGGWPSSTFHRYVVNNIRYLQICCCSLEVKSNNERIILKVSFLSNFGYASLIEITGFTFFFFCIEFDFFDFTIRSLELIKFCGEHPNF